MALLEPMWLPTKTVPFGPSAGKQGLRYMLSQMGVAEGIVNAGDFKVTQRGAGANMSVDVAAGGAWIQGDDTARQGVYHLVNDATVNVAVSAAHATLPRIDTVVARIYDSSVAGGSDTPAIEVAAGTATAGASLANLTGAAAIPNGALVLAFIQVDAATASIVNGKIGGYKLPWSSPASGAVAGAPAKYALGRPAGYVPSARGYRATAGAVATATHSAAALDGEDFDNENIHTGGQMTCRTPGRYSVTGHASWAANATGVRITRLCKNGATGDFASQGTNTLGGAIITNVGAAGFITLGYGDTVDMYVYQNSGGNLNVLQEGQFQGTSLELAWEGPA